MDYPDKDQRWVFHGKTEAQEMDPGVVRRVLAYCNDAMCVENTFKKRGHRCVAQSSAYPDHLCGIW